LNNLFFNGNHAFIEWVAAKLVRVYRYGVPFKVVEIKAGIDRRRLVIELVLVGGIIKSRLAKGAANILCINANTLR